MDLLDEVAQHLLGHVEVGDHAVLERADGGDRAGRPAEHALRLYAYRVYLAAPRVDRDDRRLGQPDPAPTHVSERVRSPQPNRHVAAPEAGDVREKSHS